MATPPFDVDAFLSRPLTARLATDGPTVRPVWFLWEDQVFWVLTSSATRLYHRVVADPRVAVVVDECDPGTGLVRQVTARGRAELVPFDAARARRKLVRYLGPEEARWDGRFLRTLHENPQSGGTAWLRLSPSSLHARDLSFSIGS